MQNIQDACQPLLEISNVIHYTSNGVANLSSLLCTSRIRYIRKHLHHYSLWFYHHICSFLSLKWQMCKTKVWIWSLVPCESLPIASMYIVQICLSIECVKDVSEHVLQVSYTFRLANIRCSLWTCRESLFLLSEAYLWYTESFILQHEFESFFFLNPYLCQSFHIFFEIKCKESTTSILCVYPTNCAYKESVSFIHIESNTWKLSFDIVVSIESSALALILILYFMCFFSINCIEMKGWMIFFHLICCKA